jgi:hypothetical protein
MLLSAIGPLGELDPVDRDQPHHLGEADRHDDEVGAAHLEGEAADRPAGESCDRHRDQHGEPHRLGADADRDGVGQVHLEAERDERARIGADAEERHVAEGELAGEAEQQVEAHRRDDEDAHDDEHVEEIQVGQPRRHRCERGEHHEGGPAAQLIRSFWANRPVGRNSRIRMMSKKPIASR